MMQGDDEGAEDIQAALDYLRQHTKVSIDPPKPAQPTPLTKRPDLQQAVETKITREDMLLSFQVRHREIAADMPKSYAAAFNDLYDYIEPIYDNVYSIAEVADFLKVARGTVWRWLTRIDPILVSKRRKSVNPDSISDEIAVAVYTDSVYKHLRRGELATKYNYPDKVIQALIVRGREINTARLKAAHRRSVT